MASSTEDPDLISVVVGAFTQSLHVLLVHDGHVHTNVLELASDGFPCCIWFGYACLCDLLTPAGFALSLSHSCESVA